MNDLSTNTSFKDGVQFALKADELLAKAKRAENGCLISHLQPNAKGYIYCSVTRAFRIRANRLIFATKNGELSPTDLVRHTCDNRACIEPSHLIKGTAADNSADMVNRNRQSRLGKPPTTQNLLQEAADLHDAGYTLAEIAKKQNLAGKSSAADRVRRGKLL